MILAVVAGRQKLMALGMISAHRQAVKLWSRGERSSDSKLQRRQQALDVASSSGDVKITGGVSGGGDNERCSLRMKDCYLASQQLGTKEPSELQMCTKLWILEVLNANCIRILNFFPCSFH